jgi:hypothetical protein
VSTPTLSAPTVVDIGHNSVRPQVTLTYGVDWVLATGDEEWGLVDAASLESSGVGWSGTAPGGATYREVINAWGGSIVATDGIYVGATWTPGIFLIHFGGGHTDYGGNEVYAYGPLLAPAASRQWYRMIDPTIPAPQNVNVDGSGNPVSGHTYGSLQYVSDGTRKWMVRFGPLARYSDAGGGGNVQVLDFDVASPSSNLAWAVKAAITGFTAAACAETAYSPTQGLVWGHAFGGNNISTYEPSTDTFAAAGFKSPGFAGGNPIMAIDDTLGILAVYWTDGSGDGHLNFYRTNNGLSNDYYAPSLTGSLPTGVSNSGTIIHDAAGGFFVIWANEGKKIYRVTPPVGGAGPYQGGDPWVVTNYTPSGGETPDTLIVSPANGIQSRMRYVEKDGLRFYTLVVNDDSPVIAYKPTQL